MCSVYTKELHDCHFSTVKKIELAMVVSACFSFSCRVYRKVRKIIVNILDKMKEEM